MRVLILGSLMAVVLEFFGLLSPTTLPTESSLAVSEPGVLDDSEFAHCCSFSPVSSVG